MATQGEQEPRQDRQLGSDFHYQEVTAFDDYFDEPLNAWNLATSRNFIHYANFSTFAALPIPNNPGWTGTPGGFLWWGEAPECLTEPSEKGTENYC